MQMTSNGCGCGATSLSCDSVIAELPRYYPRQLITPADLTLEQDYFRDRMRRHNRLLHGWGVTCGALVCPVSTQNSDGTTSFTPWQVQVQSGFALGPYGDEIIIDCARTVDLRTSGVSGVTGEPCIDAPDPWCTQVFTPPSTTCVLYIAVKYKQCMTRPVRVQPIGCGCDHTTCEYSRWHDGYEIGVLQSCPSCNACDPSVTPVNTSTLFKDATPSCPDCSCGPWVCLATVTVDSDGSITQIDNCSCRRLVLAFGDQWWKCTSTPTVKGGNKPTRVVADGTSPATLTINGTNLEAHEGEIYSFGPGVIATVTSPTDPANGLTEVKLRIKAEASAALGTRNLMIRNSDGSTVILANAITVTAASAPATPKPPKATARGAASTSRRKGRR
jgi:hypothetical protein